MQVSVLSPLIILILPLNKWFSGKEKTMTKESLLDAVIEFCKLHKMADGEIQIYPLAELDESSQSQSA